MAGSFRSLHYPFSEVRVLCPQCGASIQEYFREEHIGSKLCVEIKATRDLKVSGYIKVSSSTAKRVDGLLKRMGEKRYLSKSRMVKYGPLSLASTCWLQKWVVGWWFLHRADAGSQNQRAKLARSFKSAENDPSMQSALIGEFDLWDYSDTSSDASAVGSNSGRVSYPHTSTRPLV